MKSTTTTTALAITAAAATLALAGCGDSGGTSSSSSGSSSSSTAGGSNSATSSSSTPPTESKKLTVVTHDSFALSDELKKQFADETGYQVSYVAPGDAGSMVNQLILAKDSPLGDVVFGIDNTFSGRAIDSGILSPYTATDLPASAQQFTSEVSGQLTPIDYGDVCLNADKKWFAAKKLAVPQTLDDLVKPDYKNLLVVENPASSSPGLAFLAATVGAKGDPGYLDYWKQLKDNGVKVDKGWTEAYSTDFSGSSGKGAYPLVVSYSTSPAFEVPKGGTESNTEALLQTCFRQVEYAGVIKGAQNEVGAGKFIDFLLTQKVQESIPDAMYMYPVNDAATLPADWTKFAPLSDKPINVPAADIAKNRETWIKDWTAAVLG